MSKLPNSPNNSPNALSEYTHSAKFAIKRKGFCDQIMRNIRKIGSLVGSLCKILQVLLTLSLYIPEQLLNQCLFTLFRAKINLGHAISSYF
jgi:hypothetical protein